MMFDDIGSGQLSQNPVLTAFGEPTRDSLPRMSVAVRAPQMTPGQIGGVVSEALRYMAAGFGFLEPEDEN